MTDRREQILGRLSTLLQGISGIELVARNLDEITEPTQGSAIAVLYDGDELAAENIRSIGMAGNVVYMTPEIVISLAEVPETVGTATNAWRSAVLKTILADTTLPGLCGSQSHRGVRYIGCSTSLHPGRASQVMLTLHLSIGYAFNPTEL